MRIRAAIFDVYQTILQVGAPPADADARWEQLWKEQLHASPRLSLASFADACRRIIEREHAAAKFAGIAFPEIYWPHVAAEALPELGRLPASERDEFLFLHARMLRTVCLAPDAAVVLRCLNASGVLLGIASNAQPYTLRELDSALVPTGLNRGMFTPALCFWSFEHGFSKPDPHVFRLLTARLRAAGIQPAETLMIGDRSDNDIIPARAQGWQTWHLSHRSNEATSGDWPDLRRWLQV